MFRFNSIKVFKTFKYLEFNELFVRHLRTSCSQQHWSQQPSISLEPNEETSTTDLIISKAYEDSLKNPDYFGVNKLFTVRQLFESRVHFGHKVGTLNPHMSPYIFGSRLGHLILDLDQTAQRLREALNFTAHIAFRGGIIVFVNRSLNTIHLVEKTAKDCEQYSNCRQWKSSSFYDSTRFYGAVTRLPDLMIFLSTMNNVFETHPAVEDSAKLLIPTVGVVDTNSDPTLITYPIPGNDDTYSSVELFCNLFKQSILIAKEKRKKLLKIEN